MRIFSEEFLSTDIDNIVHEIQENGIFACEQAVAPEAIDTILDDIGGLDFRLNTNTLNPVISKHQTYQNHFMALSRVAFNLVTHKRITSICDALLGQTYRVVGKRIYETRHGNYMSFHSDVGSTSTVPGQVDGLGFIFYMSDVDDGAFEIVEGSHRWHENYLGSQENDEKLIANHSIRRFPMPKGSYVIYDGRLLHRARPINIPDQARQSFHFQVNRGTKVGEPIYVNMGWMNDLDESGKSLLGYGEPPTTSETWPITTPAHIPKDNEQVRQYLKENFKQFANVFASAKPQPMNASVVERKPRKAAVRKEHTFD